MPSLTVHQPPNNLVVKPNQPFLVTGQASAGGPPSAFSSTRSPSRSMTDR
jgi:hypothetical protein